MSSKSVTIVVPARNEAENLPGLLAGIHAACAPEFEHAIIVVDDASTDNTEQVVAQCARDGIPVELYRNETNAGQSASVHSGVTAAQTPIICTIDGDGQNPPEEVPKLVAPFLMDSPDPKLGLVAGRRAKRQDTISKRAASRFANGLRSRILKDDTTDTGCGLKAFRRDVFLELPFFNHMHRYLPALFRSEGWEIVHVDVDHRPRGAGVSNYTNLQRGLVGAVDLFGVVWLIKRKKKAKAARVELSGE